MSNKITYQDAGVDVHRGYEAVSKMKEHVKSTFTDGVLTDIGSLVARIRLQNTWVWKNLFLCQEQTV